jgi:PQQ-like domain
MHTKMLHTRPGFIICASTVALAIGAAMPERAASQSQPAANPPAKSAPQKQRGGGSAPGITIFTPFALGTAQNLVGSDTLATQLRKFGIEPDRQGVETFLRSLLITPDCEARIRHLVADLGSKRFQTREKATVELLGLPPAPALLSGEAGERDQETRLRVRQIQATPHYAEYDAKVLLVLRFIDAERLKGLAPLLLQLMPQWPEPHLTGTAGRALEASVEPSDARALRRALVDGRHAEARAAAVVALASVGGPEVEKELEVLLTDPASSVCLATAIELLNQGNRKPLPHLVLLLEADKVEVRQAAAAILSAVSGKQLAYASYDEPERRALGVAAWREWVNKEGATAELRLPVRKQPLLRGRILIGIWAERKLREVDAASGKTTFEVGGFSYLWGCHATPDGHRLAVDSNQSMVVEYDSQGKECWRHSVPGKPSGVERLDNGRTLLALPEPGLVIELDKAGQVVWKVALDGRPTTAQRLPNGNTLVTLQGAMKVVEIDSQGKVVWTLLGLRMPHTAQMLPNGNVLVLEMADAAVTEYDRSGNAVWTKGGFSNPAQAQRLPDGNTLISDNNGVMEYDRQGNLVRHIHVSRARFFAY